MTVFANILLTGLVIAFVLYPLFRRQPASEPDGRLQELRLKQATAYAMLNEIASDHEAGKLSEKDCRELETKYRQEADGILKEIDLLSGGDLSGEIEKGVRQLRRGKGRFCSQCGAPVKPGDRFCPQCGRSLAR
ncbi:MAG: zinc ribbon domain-containing protein [Dehalococcoidia bacterium]|nr:MAG: zinc ribbon domain-containing protein [Dehalococcoidia bacterium]